MITNGSWGPASLQGTSGRAAAPMRGRREFLAGLASLGAGALLTDRDVSGQAVNPRRIDVHQHFVSPKFLATLTAKNAVAPVAGFAAWRSFSPASTVENLDRIGVATAMLSITAPGVSFGDVQEARQLARDMNEFATAKMVSDYKGRFGLFAVLPLPDVQGSLQEIEYAFDTLKADGVGLLTSYGNTWLGAPVFNPVFEELNRRKAVVYTHPIDAPCCQNLMAGVAPQMLEYPTDTSRAIVNLVAGGSATRYPDIRFIFSHAGGTLIGIAGRFLGTAASAASLSKPAEPNSRLYHLRRFYYDTAGSANPVNMQALKMIVPSSQIVFGTDTPFFDGATTVQGLQDCGFTAEELRGINRENALTLLPRYVS